MRAIGVGALALAILVVLAFAAARPGVGLRMRVVLAALGYIGFVLLFRTAMRCWRSDWTDLWDDGLARRARGRRIVALLAGILGAVAAPARAQQTLFNVPSADVLERGKSYLEEDNLWGPQDPHFGVFVVRYVYGLGSRVEAGANLGGFTTPGRSTPTGTLAVKWQPLKTEGCAVTTGANGLFFLRGSRDGDPAGQFYAHLSCALPTRTRLTGGGWTATSGYADRRATRGGLFAVEQKVGDHLSVIADRFTGRNSVGYLTPGIESSRGPWTIYAAYSLKNGDSKGNAALIELGFTF